MRVLKRLFHNNRPPTADARRLEDNRGKVYWAVRDLRADKMYIDVIRKGKLEGIIEMYMKSQDVLELEDIRIFKPENRGHGLGSSMMQLVKEYAQEKSASTVWGFTPPADPNEEALRAFYLRHGFEIKPGKTNFIVTLKLEE